MTKQTNPYEDMLHLPHHVSSAHPRMPLIDRAAQFAPFAALSGHGEAIMEAARLTEARVELDESRKAVLDRQLQLLRAHIKERPEVCIVYFKTDGKKAGGAYITTAGPIKKIDELERLILMADGTVISIEDIFIIESELLSRLDD